jgi:drug/metabolite transporter (DMT)-like permease
MEHLYVLVNSPDRRLSVGLMAITILGERLTWRLLVGSSGIVVGLFLVIYALHR